LGRHIVRRLPGLGDKRGWGSASRPAERRRKRTTGAYDFAPASADAPTASADPRTPATLARSSPSPHCRWPGPTLQQGIERQLVLPAVPSRPGVENEGDNFLGVLGVLVGGESIGLYLTRGAVSSAKPLLLRIA